jgi:hypothetical protein
VVMIKIFCCLFIVVWGAQGYKTLSRKDWFEIRKYIICQYERRHEMTGSHY